MRYHYLFYFEAEEFEIQEGFFPKEPIKTFPAMLFFKSYLYKFENKNIPIKLKKQLNSIIQDIDVIEFFKIELDFYFISKQFKFFIIHFTSEVELYNQIDDEFLPIENKVKGIMSKLSSKISKIKEINHTTRLLANTYIAPHIRDRIWSNIKNEIKDSKNKDSLFFLESWEKFPFTLIFQHNFFCNFEEKFIKLLKKYTMEDLSIKDVYWDVNILDYSIKGIILCTDEKVNFKKASDLVADRVIQHIHGIYKRISDYMLYYQEKLVNLDQIISNLNTSEFINNLKSFKSNSFGERPFFYLQEIDRILIQTEKNSAERLDPPMSEIFDNPLFGYNIYDEIMLRYSLLKEEINNALIILMTKNQYQEISREEEGSVENQEEDELISTFITKLDDNGYQYLQPLDKNSSWANLYLIFSKDENELRVAKVYSKALTNLNRENFESDANKLRNINHENVVKFFNKGYFQVGGIPYFFIIMEYVRGQDFSEVNSKVFHERPLLERLKYFKEALDGINEFRKNFVLHHDLHSGNIMITDLDINSKRKIIVIDPGYSRYAYDPGDEDHDLFSIKEGIFNLFLKKEEINRITEGITLRDLKFPEIRNIITKLIEEENKRDESRNDQETRIKYKFERYTFLVRLIYLLQKHKEVCNNEREDLETIEEIGKLIEKLDIIQFTKIDRTIYTETDKFLGEPNYSDFKTYLELNDRYYQINFITTKFNDNWYEILKLDSEKKFVSIAYGIKDADISKYLKVLDDFIEYLKRRMEELYLFPLLEEIEEKSLIMKNFYRLRRFIEYLFNDEYLNPDLNKGHADERVISELKWIKQNENELIAKFTIFRRRDEPSQYNKILSLLNGKYLIHFRNHSKFNSSINTKDIKIEASDSRKIKVVLFEIFEGIKTHLEVNFNISL